MNLTALRTPDSVGIIVTDVNHHVRDLLKRELEKEGHTVFSVKSSLISRDYIYSSYPLDLVILDPDLFHPCDHNSTSEMVEYRGGRMQVLVLGYRDTLRDLEPGGNIHVVEKNGRSIDALKDIISRCLPPN